MESRHLVKTVAAIALLFSVATSSRPSCMAQQPAAGRQADLQVPPLSCSALEALVAPYAPYSDAVVEQVFSAAQYPSLLFDAAKRGATPASSEWPQSVRWVVQQPSLLKQMTSDVALTARLGVAAKQQLEETWRAVDSVRRRMQVVAAEQSSDEDAQDGSEQAGGSGSEAVVPVVPYAGAVAAALWTEAVIHELRDYRQAYYASHATLQTTTGTASATVTGPAGTTVQAQGEAVGGSAMVGSTTYYGASGSGTVSGSGGKSATGSGQVSGSVTQNGNTTSFQSNASGNVQSNFGYGGTMTRSGQGSVTQNPDGSASYQQSAQGAINGNQGSGSYSHSSSGTVTGDGSGNYQGSTSVQTQQGNVSTSTAAGNGQVTTTVDGPNGSNSYTAGDGQVGSGTSTRSMNRGNSPYGLSLGRPQSVPGDARFQGFSAKFQGAGVRDRDRSPRSSAHAFARPSTLGSNRTPSARSSRSRSSLQRSSARSTPSRSTPSRSRSSRGGGRRGRR